jgi:hypothetical protein
MELTNEQWTRIEPIILKTTPSKDPRGRKPKDPQGTCSTEYYGYCEQELLGKTYPNGIRHTRPAIGGSSNGSSKGTFQRIAQELVEDLYERGKIDIREAFIDGSFAPAKKGVLLSARQSVAKAPRSWQSQTLLVFLSPLTWKALPPRGETCRGYDRQQFYSVCP